VTNAFDWSLNKQSFSRVISESETIGFLPDTSRKA
jgi:hypothetical protein